MAKKHSQKVLKYTKIIFINLCVLTTIVLIFNLFCVSFFEFKKEYNKKATKNRIKRELGNTPNLKVYQNVNWSDLYFEEFHNLKTEYRSYIGWRRMPFQGQTINIDSAGIRKSYCPPTYSAMSSIKVALLGGSTVWGTGVNDASTISSFINKLSNGYYDVQNFGESAYNAYQSMIFLSTQLHSGFKPDIIISYDGVNNSPDFFERTFSHHRERQMIKKMKDADYSIYNDYSIKDYFLGPTIAMMNYAKSFILPRSNVEKNRISDSLAAIYLLESWLSTKILADKFDAKFICVLQPNVFVGSPVITEELGYANFSYSYYKKIFQFIELDRYRVLKGSFLDLTQAFNGKENIYIDFCHVGPYGNRVIAEKIIAHLSSYKAD